MAQPKPKRVFKQLTQRDRVLISSLRARKLSLSEIARRIGKDKSTVSRELKRNAQVITLDDHTFWTGVSNLCSREEALELLKSAQPDLVASLPTRNWTAESAEQQYRRRLWLANQSRRRKNKETVRWVKEKLRQGWGPDQIAGRSKIEAPESVSHEYVYLLVKADKKRGGFLYRRLKRFRKRKQRFGNRSYPLASNIPGRVGIEKRPAIVAKRKRLGDLEADLIQGYRHSGNILTVVDRKSKFVLLRKIKTKRATTVRKQLNRVLDRVNHRQTLTLDNGSEFAQHRALKLPVYFTHPYCSTERGTVENTNGLVRYYLPKKTSFRNLTQNRLNEIQNALNHRPRRCLGYLTPFEVQFNKLPRASNPKTSVAFVS
jgi:transposase, IS30 family